MPIILINKLLLEGCVLETPVVHWHDIKGAQIWNESMCTGISLIVLLIHVETKHSVFVEGTTVNPRRFITDLVHLSSLYFIKVASNFQSQALVTDKKLKVLTIHYEMAVRYEYLFFYCM